MTIERTATEILIRLPKSTDMKELKRFIDYLRFKEIAAKSQASQEDIDALAKEVNRNWWKKNKDRYLPNG